MGVPFHPKRRYSLENRFISGRYTYKKFVLKLINVQDEYISIWIVYESIQSLGLYNISNQFLLDNLTVTINDSSIKWHNLQTIMN